jgi:hypothetical protein
VIAQERGDYAAAEDRCRQALALVEELGDQSRTATSYYQFGVLYTEQGRAADAVPYTLASLFIRLKIGAPAPEVRSNVHWLGRQREMLGRRRFRKILGKRLSSDTVSELLHLLDSATDGGERPGGR